MSSSNDKTEGQKKGGKGGQKREAASGVGAV